MMLLGGATELERLPENQFLNDFLVKASLRSKGAPLAPSGVGRAALTVLR